MQGTTSNGEYEKLIQRIDSALQAGETPAPADVDQMDAALLLMAERAEMDYAGANTEEEREALAWAGMERIKSVEAANKEKGEHEGMNEKNPITLEEKFSLLTDEEREIVNEVTDALLELQEAGGDTHEAIQEVIHQIMQKHGREYKAPATAAQTEEKGGNNRG